MLTIAQMLERAKAERRREARRRAAQNLSALILAMVASAIIGGIMVKVIGNLAADRARIEAGELKHW